MQSQSTLFRCKPETRDVRVTSIHI